MKIRFCGIINITPDSFSDGGQRNYLEHSLIGIQQKLENFLAEGATVIDIGADSSRPGSVCVGVNEEWLRIESPLKEIVNFREKNKLTFQISIDTHHAEIAKRSLSEGVDIINDISSGGDSEMFNVCASRKCKLILMYSSFLNPHNFKDLRDNTRLDLIDKIKLFLNEKILLATQTGIQKEDLYIDPGMGRFLSEDARDSLRVIESLNELAAIHDKLFIGISRKSFLKKEKEINIEERDITAFEIIKKTVKNLENNQEKSFSEVIFRMHKLYQI